MADDLGRTVFLLIRSARFLYSVFIVYFISKSVKDDTQVRKWIGFAIAKKRYHPYTLAKEA